MRHETLKFFFRPYTGIQMDSFQRSEGKQQHAFLYFNIEDSTFHQPAKTGLSIVWKSKIS